MRAVRWLAIIVIVGLLLAAAVIDREERSFDVLASPLRGGVPVATANGGTWYCPGGSGPEGIAGVGLEIINAGEEPATALVTAIRTTAGGDASDVDVVIEPASRATVPLAALAPGADWVGAVVEVFGADVVVEQTFAGISGSDRTPCSTRAATRWIVPFGATRVESAGERMVMLLLNPFPDDAIVDIAYDADVGVDSVDGVVVPARRVVAIDVTDEVTVAARVSAVVDVVAGRLVVSRVQTYEGEEARGLAVVSAAPEGAAVWYLPTLARGDGRRDRLSVTNPSDQVAEVDVEILADGVTLDPIELTVLAGRTVQVDLWAEARLADLTTFSLVVRSLTGTPVAASVDSVVTPSVGDGDRVVGAASSMGADVAATRWLVPIDGTDGGTGSVVVANPSPSAIATIEVHTIDVDGAALVSTVELGPGRRATVEIAQIVGGRPVVVVVVESSVPVVAGRETAGLTSRSMATGVVASEPVAFSALS